MKTLRDPDFWLTLVVVAGIGLGMGLGSALPIFAAIGIFIGATGGALLLGKEWW